MKKAKQTSKDELRTEYERSDFPKGLVRGKYAGRLRESSNIVVLEPEVARAFPNQEAVNSAIVAHPNCRTPLGQAGEKAAGRLALSMSS